MENVWQQLSKEISERVGIAGRSVVAVDGRRGHTSAGIVWRSDQVLTASHTIGRTDNVGIISGNSKFVNARVAGVASGAGVALLKLEHPLDSIPAEFGDTRSLTVGEFVVAVARTRRGNVVASSGILGGLMGEWQPGRIPIDQFIRPDLTMYPGFSGGALIGSDGKILGMITAGIARGKPITIPSSTLIRVAEELLAKGHMATPYVGLVMQPVAIPESLRSQSASGASAGLLIMHVEPGAPADQAGVIIGDLLVELDAHSCDDLEKLHEILRRKGAGEQITAGLIRGGQKTELTIKIGERPLR
jgi:S1-C subfamily serine protease